MREIEIKRPYKHFKGKLYYVHDIVENTETGEKLVCYQGLYHPYKMYARPYDMFVEKVDRNKYPDAKQEFRFELFGLE